jgi:hypothetical protein
MEIHMHRISILISALLCCNDVHAVKQTLNTLYLAFGRPSSAIAYKQSPDFIHNKRFELPLGLLVNYKSYSQTGCLLYYSTYSTLSLSRNTANGSYSNSYRSRRARGYYADVWHSQSVLKDLHPNFKIWTKFGCNLFVSTSTNSSADTFFYAGSANYTAVNDYEIVTKEPQILLVKPYLGISIQRVCLQGNAIAEIYACVNSTLSFATGESANFRDTYYSNTAQTVTTIVNYYNSKNIRPSQGTLGTIFGTRLHLRLWHQKL